MYHNGLPDVPVPISPATLMSYLQPHATDRTTSHHNTLTSQHAHPPTHNGQSLLTHTHHNNRSTHTPQQSLHTHQCTRITSARSPVHNALKFSAVLGTTDACSSMTILPAGSPSMVMSKYTCSRSLSRGAAPTAAAGWSPSGRSREACDLRLLNAPSALLPPQSQQLHPSDEYVVR